MSDCNKCLSKNTCEAAFNNDSCSYFKDSICKFCEEKYSRHKVNISLGNLSAVAIGGFCSSNCYTKFITGGKR